jgi:hypothetical protein
MMSELSPEERWVWIGLLLLAGDSNCEGIIYLRKKEDGSSLGYSLITLSELLNVTLDIFQKAIEKFIKYEKIRVNEDGVIYILNWKKYQSEYQRQKPYREGEKEAVIKVTKKIVTKVTRQNKKENKKENKEISCSEKPKFSERDAQLATLLEEKIKEKLPRHKFQGKNYVETWANEFRIMREKKEATADEIETLIRWIFDKSDFWAKNILSAATLRERFGRLWYEMTDSSEKNRAETSEEVKRSLRVGESKLSGEDKEFEGIWIQVAHHLNIKEKCNPEEVPEIRNKARSLFSKIKPEWEKSDRSPESFIEIYERIAGPIPAKKD